jgi:hypothetical protein
MALQRERPRLTLGVLVKARYEGHAKDTNLRQMRTDDEVVQEMPRLRGVESGHECRITVRNGRAERKHEMEIAPGWSYEIDRDTAGETKKRERQARQRRFCCRAFPGADRSRSRRGLWASG